MDTFSIYKPIYMYIMAISYICLLQLNQNGYEIETQKSHLNYTNFLIFL